MSINIIVICVFVGVAILGFMLGFGKSLKLSTNGIFGFILSVFVCFLIGGTVKNIGAVREFIDAVNLWAVGIAQFFAYLQIGTIVYYICLFIAVQFARRLVVSLLCRLDKSGGKAAKIASKITGAVFTSVFCFGLCLLALAVLKAFENFEFSANILAQIKNSFLWTLYNSNPIVF